MSRQASLGGTHTQRRVCRGAQLPTAYRTTSLAHKELSGGLLMDIVVLRRGLCYGLGRLPGREEGWRFSASRLPSSPRVEQGAGTGGCWRSLPTSHVSSGFGLGKVWGETAFYFIFYSFILFFFLENLYFCKENCAYFCGPFMLHFLTRRCI